MLVAAPAQAPAAQKGTVPDLTWGISRSDMDRTVSLMQSAGVKWVRTNVGWNGIEPNSKGSYNSGYLSDIDYAIGKVRAAGIDVVMPVSDGVPCWASADPSKNCTTKVYNKRYKPANMQDYADFFSFVANRYAAMGVHVYEVWNEPNLEWFWPSGVSPADYTNMLRAAYPAIKQGDPQATVMVGGVSQNDYDFIQGIYAAGGRQYFDAMGSHIYPNGDPYNCWNSSNGRKATDALCSVEEIRNVMVSNGDSAKEIWITEYGFSTCSCSWGYSEAQQADYTKRGYYKFESYPYVRAVLQYNFRNTYFRNQDPGDWSAHLGLIRIDFSPKPAFEAFKSYQEGTAPPPPAANTAPSVDLTAPAEGSIFSSSLPIQATASDDKAVTKVEFRINGKLVATDSSAPYSYTWKPKRKDKYGAYTVSAKSYDAEGLSAADSVNVTRARSTTTTVRLAKGATSSSARAGRLKVSGRVTGARRGSVVIYLDRREGDSWHRGRSIRAKLKRNGLFSRRLRVGGGRWQVSATYPGNRLYAASSSARHHFTHR